MAGPPRSGIANVEFLKGHIDQVPLPDEPVDVVTSDCVINLSTDKALIIAEAARLLRPGGQFAVTDVSAGPDMDEATLRNVEQWAGRRPFGRDDRGCI
jgi:ubiquinone/menaquinone biosynthesis C-methylase UbiE